MFSSLKSSDDDITPPTRTPVAARVLPRPSSHPPPSSGLATIRPSQQGSSFPPELLAHMIRLGVHDSVTLLQILLVSARIRNYILIEEPDCASHIAFCLGKNPFRSSSLFFFDDDGTGSSDDDESSDVSFQRRVPRKIVRPPKHVVSELAEAQIAHGSPLIVLPSIRHPYVRRLHVRVKGLSQADYIHIFRCFPNVTHLTVEYAKVRTLDRVAFGALGKSLVHLELHQCGVEDSVFECPKLRDLRSLHLRACGEEGAVTTALVQCLKCLEVLEVEGIMKCFSWDSANFASVKNTLRKLVICHCYLGTKFTLPSNALGAFHFPCLEVLFLDDVGGLSDAAFNGLTPTIRKLSVKGEGYSGISQAHLASVVGADKVVEMGSDFNIRIHWSKMGQMRAPSRDEIRRREKARRILERNKEVLFSDSFQNVGDYLED